MKLVLRFCSLMRRFPMVRVVLTVPKSTISTIVLNALSDNRSVGLMKLPAALLIIRDGKSPS